MTHNLPSMTHTERCARAQEKTSILLKFLGSGEVFTTAQIAAQLWNVDRRRAAAGMRSMETRGLLKSEMHDVRAQDVCVFGITPHGLALADAYGNPRYEIGRTNGAQIEHRICGQRMRIKAEALGWTGWTPERVIRLTPNLKKIPDAAVIAPDGRRIAVEIERSIKTPKRYQEIIVAYLQEIKAGRYTEVHYVSPPGIEKLVRGTFDRIDSVKFGGEVVKLEAKHRARFRFFSFDNWPPMPTESEVAK